MFNNLKITDYLIYRHGPLPAINTAGRFQYLLAGNGLFIQAENRHWQTVIPVASCIVRGLPSLTPQLVCRHGKLPASLLEAMINNGRQARDAKGTLAEALFRVHYSDEGWRVHKPAQVATALSVNSTTAASVTAALEMHTHGAWAAYFSETDNRDEQGLGVYGVLGSLQKATVGIRLRIGVYGYFHPIDLVDVFAESPANVHDLNREERLKQHERQAPPKAV